MSRRLNIIGKVGERSVIASYLEEGFDEISDAIAQFKKDFEGSTEISLVFWGELRIDELVSYVG